MVAGHSVTVSGDLQDADHDEQDWFLLEYQKGKGLPETIIAHIKAGIEQADSNALETDITGMKLLVSALDDEKCVRCWHRRPEVGTITEHPELCSRCVENVYGDGEPREFA